MAFLHAAQWTSALERYVFPILGDLDVSQVDTDAVVNVLKSIWTEQP